MKVLVVPSNRPEQLRQFFEAWRGKGGWDSVIVIEDSGLRSAEAALLVEKETNVRHYSHAEIDHILGDDAWIISRKDSACRCFGLLAAWHLGADYVLTLDDDVRPDAEYPGLFDDHIAMMKHRSKWQNTMPERRARGMPYKNMGVRNDVVMSMGMWTGTPDLDARTQLDDPLDDYRPDSYSVNRILARGEYAPISGMNLAAKRCAIPLMYFPLMGEGQPYSRFDDIWMGIIAKKLCDHLGWSISVGEPFVRHDKASDPQVNLVKEQPGMIANEVFWEIVDSISLPCIEGGWLTLLEYLGRQLTFTDFSKYQTSIDLLYLKKLGKALRVWASLLTKKLEF